jgi:hypothetical protein
MRLVSVTPRNESDKLRSPVGSGAQGVYGHSDAVDASD